VRPAVTTEHGASALLRIAGWLSIGIAALHVATIPIKSSMSLPIGWPGSPTEHKPANSGRPSLGS